MFWFCCSVSSATLGCFWKVLLFCVQCHFGLLLEGSVVLCPVPLWAASGRFCCFVSSATLGCFWKVLFLFLLTFKPLVLSFTSSSSVPLLTSPSHTPSPTPSPSLSLFLPPTLFFCV